MDNQLSQEFIGFYTHTFKPVAEKCIEGYGAMLKVERGANPEDLGEKWDVVENAVDANAIWYVGILMSDIERALFKGKNLSFINSIAQVNGCLKSESYWTNVWKNDTSSEEAKNLKSLAGLMNELMQKM